MNADNLGITNPQGAGEAAKQRSAVFADQELCLNNILLYIERTIKNTIQGDRKNH